ncbi:MAG: hypothetical protein CVU77_06890 [Elusimicrobia bacterium HGW-Elusimicrobia-1]|nr:MAG: hypothetical protein CVU77_06890 [Elusimicrobia bacterium HGW-Elusimicrobia-1]
MMVFGVCSKCGLKLGRKSGFCPRCFERNEDISPNDFSRRNISPVRRGGIFFSVLLSVVAVLVLVVMIRALRMGMALW